MSEHAYHSDGPKTVVTLKVADAKDKTLWVAEDIAAIHARQWYVANGREPEDGNVRGNMIRLTRWTVNDVSDFWTRADNIVNLAPYA
jgi:hypothetical protein